MWLWDMWGVLWAVEALAQLAAVLATPLDPAPPIPQGETRGTLPPTLLSALPSSVYSALHGFRHVYVTHTCFSTFVYFQFVCIKTNLANNLHAFYLVEFRAHCIDVSKSLIV